MVSAFVAIELRIFYHFFQFFVAPPECCPLPRWFSAQFSTIFEAFVAETRKFLSNMHVTSLYPTDSSMFELDGRHLKSFVGKDLIDHLFNCADAGMVRVDLDADELLAADDNRLTAVEGRVDLVRHDLSQNNHRLNVVVARAAEDGDAVINEKYV